MQSAFTPVIRFISRKLVLLVAIAILIAIATAAHREWQVWRSAHDDAATLARSVAATAQHRQAGSAALTARVAALQGQPMEVVEQRIAQLRQTLQADLAAPAPLLSFPLPGGAAFGERIADYYKQQISREIAGQELAYLVQLRALIAAGFERRIALERLHQLHAAHQQAYARYLENKRLRDQLPWVDAARMRGGWLLNPRLRALEAERQRLALASDQAARDYEAQRQALAQIKVIGSAAAFALDQARLAAITGPLEASLAQLQTRVADSWVTRLARPVIDALPVAGLVLLSAFAAHLFIKLLFYYVLAPLAARLKPIRLAPHAGGHIAARHGDVHAVGAPSAAQIASAVSQPVVLAAGEELLVLADYIQSSSVHGKKDTKWLLDWAYPWTSLVSGMLALTRVRPGSDGERVVLSASADPLSELALIGIPAGSAMVFQPRALVGVIYAQARPLRITRHWRLGTLHAWLTLQLRYLVFHGPVTLIVSGARGVRVEPAGAGRTISQASTLGFSANVDYATVRCETFLPYYLGKSALLQDMFSGKSGYYVYDETPGAGKKPGFAERGLEGVVDTFLKIFGV